MLFWMTSLAAAGDLDVTVAHGDRELSASLSGLAACRDHRLTVESETDVWELLLRPEVQDDDLLVSVYVERRTHDGVFMELGPTLLLEPGQVGEVAIEDVSLQVSGHGFADVECPERVTRRTRSSHREVAD